MNFALTVGPSVLAPLHGLVNWLLPSPASNMTKPKHTEPLTHGGNSHRSAHPMYLPTVAQQASPIATPRPLKIVRILEADRAPAYVGRMVISGRMADVCAELDRLAAWESALH